MLPRLCGIALGRPFPYLGFIKISLLGSVISAFSILTMISTIKYDPSLHHD